MELEEGKMTTSLKRPNQRHLYFSLLRLEASAALASFLI